MAKFTILDTGVYRADPYVIINELQEAVAQSVEKNGGHYAHGLREVTDYIAALESRLKEAEAIIKLQNDVINRWSINETSLGEQELEARFGKIEHPDSSL